MTDTSEVNSQITESVSQVQTSTIHESPAQSFAILDLVMAETVGMGMHNAINAQHSMQMMSSAAITATCARMINGGSETLKPASKSGEASKTPSALQPEDPGTIIAAAQAEAEKAASTIGKAAQMAKQTVTDARNALSKLGAAENGTESDDNQAKDQKTDTS